MLKTVVIILHVASEVIDKFVLHGLQISHALQFNTNTCKREGSKTRINTMWKLDTSHGYHKDCTEGLSEKQYLIFQCIFFHKDETHMKQIGACIKRHTA